MDAPNPKRPCHGVSSSIRNPTQSHLDFIISSLLSFPNSSSPSIESSMDRALDKALASASSDVLLQDGLVDNTLKLTLLLHESTKRCFGKRASIHNSATWILPPELTIKVFSKLDTKSLMRAMVCCKIFEKCGRDPLSYSHIKFTMSDKNVGDGVVRALIHRAGKGLRSLELGSAVHATKSTVTPLLKGSCLESLSDNEGFIGKYLRSLHLYNIKYLKDKSSINSLAACSNLTDLKIVGMHTTSGHLLKSLRINCPFLEHLFLETYGFPRKKKPESPGLVELVANTTNLTSLTLIGFNLVDKSIEPLAEVAPKLKHLNLSRSPKINGRFLRGVGHPFKYRALETLILRDCSDVLENEVSQFLNSLLLAGNSEFIRHIDVSNNRGLAIIGQERRVRKPKFPLDKLKEERPGVKIVANFSFKLSRSEEIARGLPPSSNSNAGAQNDDNLAEEDTDDEENVDN